MTSSDQHRFEFTEREVLGMDLSDPGGCIACGEYITGCEPDLRDGPCDACGSKSVYGAQELAFMDLVDIVE